MQRVPTLPSQLVLRLLTLAIGVVVGFQFGPQLSARPPSPPAVCSADHDVSADVSKRGERLEPRIASASFLDRLAPARQSCRLGDVFGRVDPLAAGLAVSDGRPDYAPLPIVKHVPRMERGDPPRT